MDAEFLNGLYAHRFPEGDAPLRQQLWKVLTVGYLQQWFDPNDTVADLAGGGGEFLSNLVCKERILIDLAPRVGDSSIPIRCIVANADEFSRHLDQPVDRVFVSNFLEHLESAEMLVRVLREIHRALRPSGRVVILQPNIRLVGDEFWDFADHTLPISDRGLHEALVATGFEIVKLIPGFLPYTTRRRSLASPKLLKLYLHMPFLWPLFGKQTFVVAQRVG